MREGRYWRHKGEILDRTVLRKVASAHKVVVAEWSFGKVLDAIVMALRSFLTSDVDVLRMRYTCVTTTYIGDATW
jgi:hypothetical protein